MDVTAVHLQDRADALFDHGFYTLEEVGSGEEAEERGRGTWSQEGEHVTSELKRRRWNVKLELFQLLFTNLSVTGSLEYCPAVF